MKYIYAIVPTSEKVQFGALGFGDGDPHVYTIPYRDLAAVVSDRRRVNYQTLKRREILRDLSIHQKTIEKVMQHWGVLPMKFGTLLPDGSAVIELLRKGYAPCSEKLAALKGRIEMEVVATWDLKSMFAEIADEEPIAQRKRALAAGAQTATVEDRVEIGRLVKAALDARREKYRAQLLNALAPTAEDVNTNPLLTDEMVFNAAFLVDRRGLQILEKAVWEQDRQFDGKLNFKMIGPLPAYSFATIHAQLLTPRQVQEACQLFGLKEQASLRQVRAAYHSLARQLHPDMHPDDAHAQARFTEVRQAYQILAECCASQIHHAASGDGEDAICSFAPTVVGGTLLLSIRRSEGQ
ncbi:MAG: GvpL/GvpF family gas vesicle protein [Chloroflexi bacterium]|nr:GvpL/GvpF family gas vesicle protein [Chloroflexota bacterium]